MSKLLVVFGATGQQGGSVLNHILKTPVLSQQFKLRAITRDINKPAAQALQAKGIEVMSGDIDNKASLTPVLAGAHSVFATTVSIYQENGKAREIAQGKAIADAAVVAGAEYLIWSSMPSSFNSTGGKLEVQTFDSKYEVEQYIRGLPIKSAFFAPGSFMQNFYLHRRPRPVGDGTYAIFNWLRPDTKMTLVDILNDTGKFVGAMLGQPEKFEGKVMYASGQTLTFNEIAEVMSKKTGKTIKYKQLPRETYQGFMDPITGREITTMYEQIQDHGYFGPETERLVEQSRKEVGVELNTLEAALDEALPLNLDS